VPNNWPPKPKKRRWPAILIALLLVAGGVGWLVYDRLLRTEIPIFASDEDHFKYGSIGNDGAAGIPAPIWIVLPRIFPEHLPGPGGYQSLGLRWEPGHDPMSSPPIGFSRARVGVERMAINCAVCHVTSYRLNPGEPLRFALGGTSNAMDVLAYQRFLTASARDPRFTADVLLPAIEAAGIRLSWLDRQLYRYVLIPATRKALLAQGEQFAWTDSVPAWGPGRIDPFNPVKFGMLGMPVDGTIGNSDMQAIWGLGARERIRADGAFHWDGLNNSVHEVVLSSALGDGSPAGDFASWRASLGAPTRSRRRLARRGALHGAMRRLPRTERCPRADRDSNCRGRNGPQPGAHVERRCGSKVQWLRLCRGLHLPAVPQH
jgi:hypothetical protein